MAEFDTDEESARVARRVADTARQAADRFERLGPVTGQARSGDGAVRVEVRPGGLLTGVNLTRQALRDGPDALARQITELTETATRRAGDGMYRTLAPLLRSAGERQLGSLGYEPLPGDPADEDAPLMPGDGR